MIEFQDAAGRLIVLLPVRLRHAGSAACVFVNGRKVAEFKTVGEAVRHAKSLAEGRCSATKEASILPIDG